MKNSFINPINELLKGLLTVLKNGLKPRVTLEYPEIKKELNSNFRGKLKHNSEICTKCGLCKKVCPTFDCIQLEPFSINLAQCIYCGNCVEICPKKAITFTQEYELATENKEDLILKENLE